MSAFGALHNPGGEGDSETPTCLGMFLRFFRPRRPPTTHYSTVPSVVVIVAAVARAAVDVVVLLLLLLLLLLLSLMLMSLRLLLLVVVVAVAVAAVVVVVVAVAVQINLFSPSARSAHIVVKLLHVLRKSVRLTEAFNLRMVQTCSMDMFQLHILHCQVKLCEFPTQPKKQNNIYNLQCLKGWYLSKVVSEFFPTFRVGGDKLTTTPFNPLSFPRPSIRGRVKGTQVTQGPRLTNLAG